jgi:hypothetical protein
MKQLEIFKENIKFVYWGELYAGCKMKWITSSDVLDFCNKKFINNVSEEEYIDLYLALDDSLYAFYTKLKKYTMKEGCELIVKNEDEGCDFGFTYIPKRQVLFDPRTDEIKYLRPNNFRQSLVEASGINPADAQAHHVFPHSFAKEFSQAGVDVNRYGAWWQTTSHQLNSPSYNQAWRTFFITNPNPTKVQIYNELIKLKIFYGF